MTLPADKKIDAIATRFESHFRDQLRPVRMVGREAEFPVVTRDGRAADIRPILESLFTEGFTPHYDDPEKKNLLYEVMRGNMSVAIEVGRGTIELSIGPYDDLWQLQKGFNDALSLVMRVAASHEMFLLGCGIHPRTPASVDLMTPRRHYWALYGAIGSPWLKLTTTAADQTHVDISRAELLDAINWMNLLSAPIIALCANSSVYAGRVGAYVSGREGLLRELGELRYGMTPRRFTSIQEFIRYLCDYDVFVLRNQGGFRKLNRPFRNDLTKYESGDRLFQDFLWHDHYIWNSARARIQNSTIEVRPACQQPPGESFAANALILGLVESLPHIAAYLDDALDGNPWPPMRTYRRAVVREGLAAKEPASHLIRNLVALAEAGLQKRGRGEAKFLEPILKRIERRASPGMRAREIMKQKGMSGLLEQLILNG